MSKQDSKKAVWVEAAKQLIIKSGRGQLSIRHLSTSLGLTSGAFYWNFNNIEALEDALLDNWKSTNNQPFIDAVNAATDSPRKQYFSYLRVVILEDDYNPHYDNAIRDWASISAKVADCLAQIDQQRIELIASIFAGLGFDKQTALIRAKAKYFHQMGYYHLHIKENLEQRLLNAAYYTELFINDNSLINMGVDELHNVIINLNLTSQSDI